MSALDTVRSKVAKAAAPEAGGKNPDLLLATLDGQHGTLDPAFEAHGLPIKHWALAWWESWATPKQLGDAFNGAVDKLGSKVAHWRAVAGPTTALVMSLIRIGWTLTGPSTFKDDTGKIWEATRDAPEAIIKATQRSVRRWRLQRVGKVIPSLIPESPDCGGTRARETILVDFSFITTPMITGKGAGGRVKGLWNPKLRGDLQSAMVGGQWTQARKASVPSWGITDSRCQLCYEDTGTLEHRSRCKFVRPAEGWPAPPKKAMKAINLLQLAPARLNTLWTKAMLVLRLPAPKSQGEGDFQWLVDPTTRADAPEATWYFDGSLLHGRWTQFRATGFAIAVVCKGELIGYGLGSPPQWCYTAAAAEAWALATLIRFSPVLPQMRTDCMALIRTAELGTQDATGAKRALARVWLDIAHSLDGNITLLVRDSLLTWGPAHLTIGMIGERHLSNGTRLTAVDWRANRLADGLAKKAAARFALPDDTAELVQSAEAAVLYAACILGRTTHGANNCRTVEVGADGSSKVTIRRDATQAPRTYRKRAACSDRPLADPPAKRPRPVAPWVPPTPLSAARQDSKRRRERSEERLNERVQEIGATLQDAGGRPSAASRLAALRTRVSAREAAALLSSTDGGTEQKASR